MSWSAIIHTFETCVSWALSHFELQSPWPCWIGEPENNKSFMQAKRCSQFCNQDFGCVLKDLLDQICSINFYILKSAWLIITKTWMLLALVNWPPLALVRIWAQQSYFQIFFSFSLLQLFAGYKLCAWSYWATWSTNRCCNQQWQLG